MSPIPIVSTPSFDLNDTMGIINYTDSGELLRILCNSSFQNDTEFYSGDEDQYFDPLVNCSNTTIPDNSTRNKGFAGFVVIIGIAAICCLICCCVNFCNALDCICNDINYCNCSNCCKRKERIYIKRVEFFEDIEETTLKTMSKKKEKIYSEDCAVCTDKLDGKIRVLPCKHAFHKDCLKPWIKSMMEERKMPICPVCRQNIYSEISFQKKINVMLGRNEARYTSIENIVYSSDSSDNDYY